MFIHTNRELEERACNHVQILNVRSNTIIEICLLDLKMNACIFASRHEVHSTNTLFLYNAGRFKRTEQNVFKRHWRLIDRITDTYFTERFAAALEAQPQGYRHILNSIVR